MAIVTCTQISAYTHSHLITHLHTYTHSLPHNIYYPDSQMASNCVRYTTIEVNCAFARVAIRELTPKIHGYQQINTQKRALEFRELFKDCSNYGIEDSYFEQDRNDSMFNRDCSRILGIFKKKWNPKEARVEYEETFSSARWKALSTDKQQLHTLSKCKACLKDHHKMQMAFPQSPYYEEEIVSINMQDLQALRQKQATRQVLAEINTTFTNAFDSSFTDLLVKHSKEIQKKPTAAEKKKRLRSIYRHCRDQENEALKKSAAISVLTEDESMRAYQRKRKRQYFETPPAKKAKMKSHSPNFSDVTWNKEEVLCDLQQHPLAPPPINWQKFAREHNVPGQNAGQVVKQFAHKSGLDTTKLDGRPTDAPRTRSQKRRLIGGEISAPSTPSAGDIKNEWRKMIESKELCLGVSCIPYTIQKFATNNGQLERK